ncbi:MAG: ftsK [Rickettsiaceae bacterium]|jgi:S-DNA-T family DNA segregation ATPase FtsK/SpoIIIE|nr:ftsK [Rickettsiaceae bacterium]
MSPRILYGVTFIQNLCLIPLYVLCCTKKLLKGFLVLLSFIRENSRRITIAVYLLLGVYFTGMLLSFNSLDPSFNRATSAEATNVFGSFGSYLADPFLQFIGVPSVLIAITFLVWACRKFFDNGAQIPYVKAASLIFAIVCFSGITSVITPPESWPFYVSMGGFLGDLLNGFFSPVLTTFGFAAVSFICGMAALYFAWGMTEDELKVIYSVLREASIIAWKVALVVSVAAVNLVRVLFKKEPIELRQAEVEDQEEEEEYEDEEESEEESEEDEEKEEFVEFKEPKPKKKKVIKQTSLKLDPSDFELPDFEFLTEAKASSKSSVSSKSLEQNAKLLKKVLEDFGVKGEILKVRPGPVVTLYELEPAAGTKSSRVIGLADDIARSMSSISARISVIPGRNLLGIELPNAERETVYLRELMETEEYRDERIKLPIALGKDIGGGTVMADLARMPHLLIAGTTGSGKSVAVNAMILSYLYRLTPDECKFIMIDPKMLELSVYEGIPHLLAPVVTEPKKAIVALKWAVHEMEDRYRLMSNLGVRNITGYNKRIEDAVKDGEVLERTVQTGFDPETGDPIFEKQPLDMNKLPFIVVIVDEMADLMLTAGKEIESSIQRLAQMARAAGIHMVMATQRPSVDVITGVIKANFPTRISFQVTSRIDSRTILGEMGAEQLLGMGDMLYMAGGGRITRVHGPFVDDKEVDKVVTHLKAQGAPAYVDDITKEEPEFDEGGGGEGGDGDLYDRAVAIVLRDKKASTSYIQRQLRIGYNRAADLIDRMEREGVISAANHAGKREVIGA